MNACVQKNFCPYYVTKELTSKADIVLMPYNYFFDLKLGTRMNVVIRDNIVIIDEAHNVPDTVEELNSFKLNSNALMVAFKELKGLELKIKNPENKIEKLAIIDEVLHKQGKEKVDDKSPS